MRFFLLFLLLSPSAFAEKRLVILGDSLTEGYGVAKDHAFPALVEKKLKAAGMDWKVINAGVSGSTSASAISRLDWLLKSKPDAVLIALGGNDGLRGFGPKVTKENLKKAIQRAKTNGVKTYLAGIQMPPNYGKQYTEEFRALFPTLAKEEKIALLPFLLETVGGNPKYNLPDGIHPNEEGHKILAETVFAFLRKNL
jgi:acyl-CoA thioesterase-1